MYLALPNIPSWATFDSSSGELTGTPVNDDVGEYSTINITVTDSGNESDKLATFSITVTNTNDAPQIDDITEQTVSEDSSIIITFNISDVDVVDSLTIESLSLGVSESSLIDSYEFLSTNNIIITPNADSTGTTNLTIFVSDGTVTSSTQFKLTIANINDSPVISGFARFKYR